MKTIKVSTEDVRYWRDKYRVFYVYEKSVRMYCLLTGEFTVIHNSNVVYQGYNSKIAASVFNECLANKGKPVIKGMSYETSLN